MQTIPGEAVELRYLRTGQMAGPYRHTFKRGVKLYALNDGSVLLKGRETLHADDRTPGFWRRYGRHRTRRIGTMARPGGGNLMMLAGIGLLGWAWWSGKLTLPSLLTPRPAGASVQRPGDAAPFLPQPFAYWHNPTTTELFLAGADGLPPGTVPPWRLASEDELGQLPPAEEWEEYREGEREA